MRVYILRVMAMMINSSIIFRSIKIQVFTQTCSCIIDNFILKQLKLLLKFVVRHKSQAVCIEYIRL
jgi:hypothetical protein